MIGRCQLSQGKCGVASAECRVASLLFVHWSLLSFAIDDIGRLQLPVYLDLRRVLGQWQMPSFVNKCPSPLSDLLTKLTFAEHVV
jgi:hypothetical protein